MDENIGTQVSLSDLEVLKKVITDDRASIVKEVCEILSCKLSESLTETLSNDLSKSLSESITKSLSSDIENAISRAFHGINEKFEGIQNLVETNSHDIVSIKNDIEQLHMKTADQQIEIEKLKCENVELKLQMTEHIPDGLLSRLAAVEERVEERTNRQLRQTLVFQGIEEKGKESWADTKHILAESVSETCDVTYEDAEQAINRCHRSGSKTNRNGRVNRHRPIYANFFSWEVTEDIIVKYRESNIKFPHFNIKANYKYGPLTTKRRSEALKVRKELKESNVITKGFIKYPAKLFVMYKGESLYREHQDFSKMEVEFNKGAVDND